MEDHSDKMPKLGCAGSALRKVSTILTGTAAVILVVMMFHVSVDVAARFLKLPLIGTNETVAAYYMVAIVFLPMAQVALMGANVTVDLFSGFMRWKEKLIGDLIAAALGMCVSVTWLWLSIREAMHSTKIVERWVVGSDFLQVWPGKWILVLAVAFLCIAYLVRLIGDARTLMRAGPDGPTGAGDAS